MKTFTIDSNNKLSAYSGEVFAEDGVVKFKMEQELTALASTWPGARLADIWNHLPGVRRVAKFTNRNAAVTRIWKQIQALQPKVGKPTRVKTQTPVTGAEAPTKTARVIELLKRPEGATLKELMALTGWQPHSIRGFLSAQLSKRMGLRIKSFSREGERVYRSRG